MGSKELTQWMAFFNLEDEEYKNRIEKEVNFEDGKDKTNEELAQDLKAMLIGLKGNG
jgi:hypothetical protein